MSISFSGLASGLDTSSWITSLTQLRQAKVTTLETQKASVVSAQSTLQSIRSFFSAFRSTIEKITDSKFNNSVSNIFAKKTALSSNLAALTATVKSNAAEGIYEVTVKQTATQTQAKSGYCYTTTLISTTQAKMNSYLSNVGIGYGVDTSSGIKSGNIDITRADGSKARIFISSNETMESFLDKLHNEAHVEAAYDSNTGIFSIGVSAEDIDDVDNTGILSKLKISSINYGYTGDQLSIEESHTEYEEATSETLLSLLGVNAGTLTISTDAGDYEVILDEEDTIGSLVSALRSEGIEAAFTNGVFSINNAYISDDGTTNLIEAFGIATPDVASQTQESGGLKFQTIWTETTTASGTTLLKDIDGVNLDEDKTIVVKNALGVESTVTVGTTTSINDLIGLFNDEEVGLNAEYDAETGRLSIHNGWIVTGGTFDVEGAFGLVYTPVAATVTGSLLTVTTTTITGATGDTTLKDLTTEVTSGNIDVTDTLGVVHHIEIDQNTTINDFLGQIRALGLGADFNETTGVLTLTGGSYTAVANNETPASNILNVFFNSDTLEATSVNSSSASSAALRVEVANTQTATGTITMSQLGLADGTYEATFKAGTTDIVATITQNTTLSELESDLRSKGLDIVFNADTGKFTIEDGEYIGVDAGTFGDIMGFTSVITGRYATSSEVLAQTVTIGKELTSAGVVYHTIAYVTTVTTTTYNTAAQSSTGEAITYQTTVTTQTGETVGMNITGETLTYGSVTTTAAGQTSDALSYVVIGTTDGQVITVGNELTSSQLAALVSIGAVQTSDLLSYQTVTNNIGTYVTVGMDVTGGDLGSVMDVNQIESCTLSIGQSAIYAVSKPLSLVTDSTIEYNGAVTSYSNTNNSITIQQVLTNRIDNSSLSNVLTDGYITTNTGKTYDFSGVSIGNAIASLVNDGILKAYSYNGYGTIYSTTTGEGYYDQAIESIGGEIANIIFDGYINDSGGTFGKGVTWDYVEEYVDEDMISGIIGEERTNRLDTLVGSIMDNGTQVALGQVLDNISQNYYDTKNTESKKIKHYVIVETASDLGAIIEAMYANGVSDLSGLSIILNASNTETLVLDKNDRDFSSKAFFGTIVATSSNGLSISMKGGGSFFGAIKESLISGVDFIDGDVALADDFGNSVLSDVRFSGGGYILKDVFDSELNNIYITEFYADNYLFNNLGNTNLSNIYIDGVNLESTEDVHLFNTLTSCSTIENMQLTNISLFSRKNDASLFGTIDSASISGLNVSETVIKADVLGNACGLAETISGGGIRNVKLDIDVISGNGYAAGIAGSISGSDIDSVVIRGSVKTAGDYAYAVTSDLSNSNIYDSEIYSSLSENKYSFHFIKTSTGDNHVCGNIIRNYSTGEAYFAETLSGNFSLFNNNIDISSSGSLLNNFLYSGDLSSSIYELYNNSIRTESLHHGVSREGYGNYSRGDSGFFVGTTSRFVSGATEIGKIAVDTHKQTGYTYGTSYLVTDSYTLTVGSTCTLADMATDLSGRMSLGSDWDTHTNFMTNKGSDVLYDTGNNILSGLLNLQPGGTQSLGTITNVFGTVDLNTRVADIIGGTSYIKFTEDSGFSTFSITESTTLIEMINSPQCSGIFSYDELNNVLRLDDASGIIDEIGENLLSIFPNGIYTVESTGNITNGVQTTFGEMGLTDKTPSYITLSNGDRITVTSSDTIANVCAYLTSVGISASLSAQQTLVIGSASDNIAVADMTSDLKAIIFGNPEYSNLGNRRNYNTIVNYGTTLGELNSVWTDDSGAKLILNDNTVLHFTKNSTIRDVREALYGYGINSHIENNRFYIDANANNFITSMDDKIAKALNLKYGKGATYASIRVQAEDVTTTYAVSVTSSEPIMVMNYVSRGTESIITYTVPEKLANAGEQIASVILVAASERVTTSVTTTDTVEANTDTVEATTDTVETTTVTLNATTTQMMGTLGLTNPAVVTVNTGEQITINSSDTLGSAMQKLQGAGLIFDYDASGGRIDIMIDYSGKFITNISNSQLETIFGFRARDTYLFTGNNIELAVTRDLLLDGFCNSFTDSLSIIHAGDVLSLANETAAGLEQADFTVGANSTVGDMIDFMTSHGMNVTLSDTGRFKIQSGSEWFVDATDGSILENFGLDSDMMRVYEPLSYDTQVGKVGSLQGATIQTNLTTYTFSASATMQDIKDALEGAKIIFDIDDQGMVSISTLGGSYITNMSSNLAEGLKINVGAGNSYDTYVTSATYFTNTVTATSDDTLGLLGLTEDGTISIHNYDDTDTVISVSTSDTVLELRNKLNSAGISATYANGILTVGNTEDNNIITGISESLSSFLNINAGLGSSYNTVSGSVTQNTALSSMGFEGSGTITTDNGVYTFNSSNTLGDIKSTLEAQGINVNITDSAVTFSPTEGHYIRSISSNLADTLGVSPGFGESYDIDIIQPVSTTTTIDATGTTTFNDLGMSSVGRIVTNTGVTVTVNSTDTIDTFITNMNAEGVGVYATFNAETSQIILGSDTDDNYIMSITPNLSALLNIASGQGNSYNTDAVVNTASTDTTMAQLGMQNGATGYIRLNNDTVTVASTATIQDVIDGLSTAGITATLSEDGKLTINAGDGVYIESISSSLANVLRIEAGNNISYHITSEITDTTNTIAALTTTMDTLGMHSSGKIFTNNATITIQSTDTIQDVINALGAEGIDITASYNDSTGVFTLGNAEDTNYVTGMSQALAAALGNISTGQGFTYNITSDTNSEEDTNYSVSAVTTSQNFGDIGITSTGGVINLSNGETVTVNNETTISSFITDMGNKGFDVTLTNGIFNITAQNGTDYIVDCTDENILAAMNIVGATYNTNTLNLGNTKLKDLKDSSGNNLGITTGNIRIYKNGIANTVNISNEITLDELSTILGNYNIQLVYGSGSSGNIYFTSTGNSYMESIDGGTNLLTQLNTENWTAIKDSVSQELTYTTNSDIIVDTNTKLVDLKNTDGTSAGITTGNYKIVSNGINYAGTIDATTSIGDFFTQLAMYGITGTLSSNGQITLSSSQSNTYLETAEGAEGYSNIVDTLFSSWSYGNVYVSRAVDVTNISTSNMTAATRLKDIDQGTYQAGKFVVDRNGVETTLELGENATVEDFMSAIRAYGFTSYINNGRIVVENDGVATLKDYSTPSERTNVVSLLGIDTSAWEQPGYYIGSEQTTTNYHTELRAATRDTKLSDLRDAEGNSLEITTGEFYVYRNGVRNTLYLNSTDITLENFTNMLASYGINAIYENNGTQTAIKLSATGNSYVETSTVESGATNIVDVLFNDSKSTLYSYEGYQQTSYTVTTTAIASLATSVSDYDQDGSLSAGTLALTVDGHYTQINITSYETFGSLLEKFELAGVKASLTDGVIRLETGNRSFEIDEENSTSNLLSNLGLSFSNNLGGFAASTDAVTQTTTVVESRTLSVAKYADYDTQMGLLNITSGSLSIYKNGLKRVINIDNTETFSQFRTKIQTAFGGDIDIDFRNGKLRFFAVNEGVDVQLGSSNDTSNISSICGFSQDENGDIISARELYKVNASSKITTEGLFRKDDVTEGTFIVGDETFTITNDTTIQNIIAQINSSDKSNASAYWDSVDGKLIISSRTTGASMINIEAGTSNFTDILGLTDSEWNDGVLENTKILVNSQTLGNNASFSINGTNFSSSSNIITSDVSRIQGLTLNLKSATPGQAVTVTISQDTEVVTEALGEFVDAYNELIENVDNELSSTGALKDQSTLKFIRQQIRNLLVNTFDGATTFKNLAALGISTTNANAANISTSNVEYLYFDPDKFMEGYNKDSESVKNMLVGSDETPGILLQIENIVENALATGTGYFSSADKSYSQTITSINEKIRKANASIEAYRARLEAKFQSMDMLISNMQNQYNSFMTSSGSTSNIISY